MNANIRYAILAALVIVILASLVLTTSSPLLYTLEEDTFPSPFHQNVDVHKQQSLNTTTDVVPEIQDFIDFSGPVSLSIRVHDIEQARRDMERFRNSHGTLKNLIVKLEMNESEIQEIEKNTALQKEILDSLLNTSMSLEALQMMEIQYHSENNQDMLTTIRLRGDELRRKVRGMSAQYRNATEKVAASSKKLGINATKNMESQQSVDQIIEQIEHPQAATLLAVDTALVPGDERLSLFLRPDSGRYREVIEYQGISLTLKGNTTLREESRQVILYIDDVPSGTVSTDSFGYYNIKLAIERIAAGDHTVYSRTPSTRSGNRTLTIIPVMSITNLTISRPEQGGRVNCSGVVMANYPVRSATIQITWDTTHVLVTKTDARGWFMKEIQLPEGRHTIVARFSGEGYPISSSESDPQVIEISKAPDNGNGPDLWNILLIIFALVILLGFIGATVYYLRRMTRKIRAGMDKKPDNGDEVGRTPAHEEGDAPALFEDTSDLIDSDHETLIAYYTRLLNEKGLKAASWRVYQQLAARVARDQNIRRHRTLTAREMSRTCKGKPYCRPFARFIAVYERIRYGDVVSVKDQAVFETALHTTDDQMEEDHH